MQLLHCEYELINSYNCPVIVFFVCRLFFFSLVRRIWLIWCSRAFALSKIAWILFVCIFPSEITLFIQLELHTLVCQKWTFIFDYVCQFSKTLLPATLFLARLLCFLLFLMSLWKRVRVFVLRRFAIRISFRLIRHLFLYLLQ